MGKKLIISLNLFLLNSLPGNKILNKMGLSLLKDTISGSMCFQNLPESSEAIVDKYYFRHLLYQVASCILEDNELSQHQMDSLNKLGRDCAKYLQIKAYDHSPYAQVVLALYDLIVKEGMPQVSHGNKTAQQLTPWQSDNNNEQLFLF